MLQHHSTHTLPLKYFARHSSFMFDQLAAELVDQIVALLIKGNDLRSLALVVSVDDSSTLDAFLTMTCKSQLAHEHAIRELYRNLYL
jgi:hypothetical protein